MLSPLREPRLHAAPARALGPRTRGYPSGGPMTPNSPPPVLVDRVQKRFEIPRDQVSTLKERALHPFRRSVTDTLHALRGVSFAVEPGEFFGIVGRNGSGKSTLLKCLAGIYSVDSGKIYVNGRMSTFIELGVGFNPDLPARDNALLNATMLGLSPREARKRFDSVIDFAELGDFVEMKIKNYSSGMLVRLAFAVMIHVDAEILLIDEVLAVGDASFQQKCYDEFERIRDSGSTVLFVTHDMSAVQRFCDRALLLEHGRPVVLGDPEHVGNRYLELNFSEQARQVEEAAAEAEGEGEGQPAASGAAADGQPDVADAAEGAEPAVHRYGDGRAEIYEAWFEDEHGVRAETLQTGRQCSFGARVRFHGQVENPLFGINLQNGRRDHLLSASNLWSEPRCGSFAAGDEVTFRIRFENVLAPDRYYVTPAVARHGGAWIDRRERMISIVVTGTQSTDALLELPYEMVIERGTPHAADAQLVR
ncbi:MAG: transporter related protein [Solirubrobacterales bacterium]|nr:transporter related protein [Solirubrobacterales bacterium]